MTGWSRGRAEILGMIERRELTQVTADAELADRLLAAARQHVVSAGVLADSDPYLAYAALHDAMVNSRNGRPTRRTSSTPCSRCR
jgi:hypothetical protein